MKVDFFNTIERTVNMWGKNIVFFWISIIFIIPEAFYWGGTSFESEKSLFEQINIVAVILWALPSLILLGLVLGLRFYFPKAKWGNGIMVCIINADAKQFDAIRTRFYLPLYREMRKFDDNLNAICIDSYHSKKTVQLIHRCRANGNNNKVVHFLQRKNCIAALIIDCTLSGEYENIVCTLNIESGVLTTSFRASPLTVQNFGLGNNFEELHNIRISKLNETEDFANCARASGTILPYTIACIMMHTDSYEEALQIFTSLYSELKDFNKKLPTIRKIKDIVPFRIGLCCSAIAHREYTIYRELVNKHGIAQSERLRKALVHLENKHCLKLCLSGNDIVRSICYFLHERNPQKAMDILLKSKHHTPLITLNKTFLSVFMSCEPAILVRAKTAYKCLNKISDDVLLDAEQFIDRELQNNETKCQLLFLLLMLYDYRNDMALARETAELIARSSQFPHSYELDNIMNFYYQKYDIAPDTESDLIA